MARGERLAARAERIREVLNEVGLPKLAARLDHETRRLLVLGMTMGLARWEEFELHCRAAIRGGVPLERPPYVHDDAPAVARKHAAGARAKRPLHLDKPLRDLLHGGARRCGRSGQNLGQNSRLWTLDLFKTPPPMTTSPS